MSRMSRAVLMRCPHHVVKRGHDRKTDFAQGMDCQTALAAKDVDVRAQEIELLTADNLSRSHEDNDSLKVGVFARVQERVQERGLQERGRIYLSSN